MTRVKERRIMAKKDMHTFNKFKKEQKRKEKASEKLARRQEKKDQSLKDSEEQGLPVEKADNF
jgi:hypothetical protein